MLMRVAQTALMPSPRCLDSPPAGMMQLHHRESVVQFVKEVRTEPAPNPLKERRPGRLDAHALERVIILARSP